MAAAELLVPFCEAASISATRDVAGVVKKRFIVSLCFANTRVLHDALFPDQHMDWVSIKEFITQPSSQDWLSLIELVDFENEQPNRQMVTELVASTLAGIKVTTQGKVLSPLETMQLCFAKAGLAPSWDTLCKTLVLCNLAEVDHATVLQQFLKQQPAAAIDGLVKALPSCKHTPEEYTRVFVALFGQCCHVRTHLVHEAMDTRSKHRERVKKHAQSVYHTHKKPSLTQILELKVVGSGKEGNNYHTDAMMDSFAHFCNISRLPSNASLLVKQAIYYLCVVGETTANAALMMPAEKPNIITPDMQALKSFLADVQYTGAPCHSLRQFKEKCIPGGQNWSTVLRFYLAAYCKPVSKELWRFALQTAGGGLCASSETEMSAQRFVAQTPLDATMIWEQAG